MLRFAFVYLAFMLVGLTFPAHANRLEIKAPHNDAATSEAAVTIMGETDLAIPYVELTNNGDSAGQVPVIGGRFQLSNFNLLPGANLIEASANGIQARLLLFRIMNV
ncbi:MAG TPA: hypothetical protein VF710_18125, partial [Longimicrobium sp.]